MAKMYNYPGTRCKSVAEFVSAGGGAAQADGQGIRGTGSDHHNLTLTHGKATSASGSSANEPVVANIAQTLLLAFATFATLPSIICTYHHVSQKFATGVT